MVLRREAALDERTKCGGEYVGKRRKGERKRERERGGGRRRESRKRERVRDCVSSPLFLPSLLISFNPHHP
jgi:hypothetical protein